MDKNNQLQMTLFALEQAKETNLYQFRKLLLITREPDKFQAGLARIFPNAQIFTLQERVDFLNSATPQRHCFDLILIDEIDFPQINQIFYRFKCRYIFVTGQKTALYVREIKNYERFVVGINAVLYKNRVQFYDAFLPIGPLDLEIAEKSVQNKVRFLPGLREIFYCAKTDLSIDANFISETRYPFSEDNVQELRAEQSEKIGGYHAQLKQFYLHTVEPATLDFYVALCTDVFFLKPYEFFDENNLPIYMYGAGPTHPPSLEHMQTLHPQLRCFDDRSAVAHHMLFERAVLRRLMYEVECFSGQPFWKTFIKNIEEKHFLGTGTSDYDIYFNFLRLIRRPIALSEPNYLDTGDPKRVEVFKGDFYCDHAYTRGNRE